jgi:hypothetical protein
MGQANAVSGQVAVLTIPGIGAFGVTKVESHRTFINADTTVTQFSWEQATPVCRGMTLDVSIPITPALTAWVDDIFDSAEFTGTGSIAYANAPTCTLSSNPAGGETFTADYLIEDHRVAYDSKDAARIIFTLKATGKVTA